MGSLLVRIRNAGWVVENVYVAPEPYSSMRQWAQATLAEIVRRGYAEQPLRLIGYCLGGHLAIEVLALLSNPGDTPAYAGLIDTWDRTPVDQMRSRIYHRYRVGVRRRVRHQLLALTRPEPVRLRSALFEWSRAAALWAPLHLNTRIRGHRKKSHWYRQHLAYNWTYSAVNVPVHLYNSIESIRKNGGDQTMGLSPNLRGGYVLRQIGGDHDSCVSEPHVDRLADLVLADLATPVRIVEV